jgi:plastocyanin
MKKLLSLGIALLGAMQWLWATTHTVVVSSFQFTPNSLTIQLGDTVRFNCTSGSHNVNGSLSAFPTNLAGFTSGPTAAAPWTFLFVPTLAGTYQYRCDPHSGSMVGSITVQAGGGGTAVSGLVLTEIMYNPPEPGIDTLEYMEFRNINPTPLNLTGVTFTRGIIYTFPSGTIVPAGGYIVICKNLAAFQATFPSVTALEWGGTSTNALSNNGEAIVLRDALGNLVDSVSYGILAPWPTTPNGQGPSLVLCDPSSDNTDPANWLASTTNTGVTINGLPLFGSPGANDAVCSATSTISFAPTMAVSYTHLRAHET